MKKIILSAAVALFLVVNVKAQVKDYAITFAIEIDGLPAEQAAMMKGMELKTYNKTGKSRQDMSTPFSNTSTFMDEKGGSITLIDAMGQKKFMKNKAEETKDKAGKEPKITYSAETKTIAGYECKKAVVEFKNEKGEMNKASVWFTEKLANTISGGRYAQFKGIKGAPLEFEMAQGPMKMKIAATAVSTAPIPDSKFTVSTEGYSEMTPEEMKMMMGGGGQ